MYVCIQVVGTDGVLPMLHTQTEKEGAGGDESLDVYSTCRPDVQMTRVRVGMEARMLYMYSYMYGCTVYVCDYRLV
jgi:hypothetical protein